MLDLLLPLLTTFQTGFKIIFHALAISLSALSLVPPVHKFACFVAANEIANSYFGTCLKRR